MKWRIDKSGIFFSHTIHFRIGMFWFWSAFVLKTKREDKSHTFIDTIKEAFEWEMEIKNISLDK